MEWPNKSKGAAFTPMLAAGRLLPWWFAILSLTVTIILMTIVAAFFLCPLRKV